MWTVYGDGACSVHSMKCGGIGVRVYEDGVLQVEISDHYCNTTNNKMELEAVIVGILHTPPGAEVVVYTDSMYVVGHANGWYKASGRESQCWVDLELLCKSRTIAFKHVKRNTVFDQTLVDVLSKKGLNDGKHDVQIVQRRGKGAMPVLQGETRNTLYHVAGALSYLDC